MFYYSVPYCVQKHYCQSAVPYFGMVDISVPNADDIIAIRKAVSEKIHEDINNVTIFNFFPIDFD